MRKLVQTALFSLIGSISALPLAAEVLTITNLPDVRPAENNRTNFAYGEERTLDLKDFFQVYPNPGPVLTIRYESPAIDDSINQPKQLFTRLDGDSGGNAIQVNERPMNFITYKFESGETYDHIHEAEPSKFIWEERFLVFQLHAEKSQTTIGNFMSYLKRGEYNRSIIHRRATNPNVIQGGGFRMTEVDLPGFTGEFPAGIVRRNRIPLEPNLEHVTGTLAMARTQQPDSATNQFFINVGDNTFFSPEDYAAFGELISNPSELSNLTQGIVPPGALADQNLNEFLQDLGSTFRSDLSTSQPAWNEIPLYAPSGNHYINDPRSFVIFEEFLITEGSTDGISLSWEFYSVEADEDDEDAPEPVEPDRESFEIDIDDDGILNVKRRDTGFATIIVKASYQDQESEFFWNLAAYNPEVGRHVDPSIEAFPGNLYTHNVMGTFFDIHAPYLYHESLGNIWISRLQPDGQSIIGSNRVYIKDNVLGWLYGSNAGTLATSRPPWPWLYSIENEAWVFHVVESTPDNRFFWDTRTEEWFSHRWDNDAGEWVPFRWDSDSESWYADADFFNQD